MRALRLKGDNNHLYFEKNETKSYREELFEIMDTLTSQGCAIKDKIPGPDCDLYTCTYNGLRFAICTATDDGSCICVDKEADLDVIERLFE